MAKRKNTTAHNKNAKAYRTGIKKPKQERYTSLKGYVHLFLLPFSATPRDLHLTLCHLYHALADLLAHQYVLFPPPPPPSVLFVRSFLPRPHPSTTHLSLAPCSVEPKFLRNLRFAKAGNRKAKESTEEETA